MNVVRQPIISAIGVLSRDETLLLDHFPVEGTFAIVSERLTALGGTTGNIATSLARLGADVRIFTKIGDDHWGKALIQALANEGVDTREVKTGSGQSDLSIMLVSGSTRERTILWEQGPALTLGDQIDVDRLFKTDLSVIDTPDYELVRFLTDLPAHTYPRARLLGTLAYLADVTASDKLDVACRFDVLVGNEREFCLLTGESTPELALLTMEGRMAGSNLRLAVMTQGDRGAVAVTAEERTQVPPVPVTVADTTGAGDAFTAGLAYAIAVRWDLSTALNLAASVASFVVETLGAQIALPTLSAALARVGIATDDGSEFTR